MKALVERGFSIINPMLNCPYKVFKQDSTLFFKIGKWPNLGNSPKFDHLQIFTDSLICEDNVVVLKKIIYI